MGSPSRPTFQEILASQEEIEDGQIFFRLKDGVKLLVGGLHESRRISKTTGEHLMEKIRIVSQTRVHGEVEYNDGDFAEIQTVGIEGMEKDLLLETIQVHRNDASYTCDPFKDKLPVGSWLDVCKRSR